MKSIKERISALEAGGHTGILLMSWQLDGAERAQAVVRGVPHLQGADESREQFLDRLGRVAQGPNGPAVLWVSELDARL